MDYDDMDRTCMLDIGYDIVDFIIKRSSLDSNINEYVKKLITLCQTKDSVISTEITIPVVHTQAQISNCMNKGTPYIVY